jgi:hypothetical protein
MKLWLSEPHHQNYPSQFSLSRFATIASQTPQSHPTIDSSMASPRKERAEWDDPKDMYLIRHILKATCEGKKSDTGIQKGCFS